MKTYLKLCAAWCLLLSWWCFFPYSTSAQGKARRIKFADPLEDARPTKIVEKRKGFARLKSKLFYCDIVDIQHRDGRRYKRIVIPGARNVGRPGLPERPFRIELARIHAGTKVELVIDNIKWRDLDEDIVLAPIQPPMTDMRSPPGYPREPELPFAKDEAAYRRDEFAKTAPVRLGERIRIRGKEYIQIIYDPLSYNPVKKRLRIAHEVGWHLELSEPEGVESKQPRPSRPETRPSKPEKMDLLDLRSKLLKKQEGRLTSAVPQTAPGTDLASDSTNGSADADYLIVTPDRFIAEVVPLSDWKRNKGLRTYVAGLSEVGGSDAQAIKAYIENAYSNGRLTAYVLLIGDHEDLPGSEIGYHPSCYGSNVPFYSDHPYACVDGPDFYPDLVIGRLPGDTEAHIRTMVAKIIAYETDPDTSNNYRTVLVAGMFQDDEYQNYTANRWFMEDLHRVADFLGPSYGFFNQEISKNYSVQTALQWVTGYGGMNETHFDPTDGSLPPLKYKSSDYPGRIKPPAEVPQVWKNEGRGDKSKINAAIVDGVGLVIHRDHGYASYGGQSYDGLGWGDPDYRTGDVTALSNGTRYPIVFSLNCGTGHWEDRDAFGEAWLRSPAGGAVGFAGAARISYSSYNDALLVGLMDSFWDDYSSEPNEAGAAAGYPLSFRPAEALTRAKAFVLDTGGSGDFDYGTTTARLFNFFGDPEMEMRTETPFDLVVTHQLLSDEGAAPQITVSVKKGDIALQEAQVAIVKDNELLAVQLTDHEGKINFVLAPDTGCGTVALTVTTHNAIPYQGSIQLCSTLSPPSSFRIIQ